LPGYTDGTCPFDNNRYFSCPQGQGYYILETGFINSYEIIQKKRETKKLSTSDDEFNSAEQSLSTSPIDAPISPKPIQSSSSPMICQTQHSSDNNPITSPSRGVLRRLAFEREQRKSQISSSLTSNKDSFNHTSSIESDPRSSRTYCPENYRSTSYDKIEELNVHEFTAYDNENNFPPLQLTNNNNRISSTHDIPSFSHEYFLDNWTLGRVKNLLEKQISLDNQLCLNIYDDQYNVEILVDEQINGCLSLLPSTPPKDIRIELIKLYDHVEIIFPSRRIRLYDNNYLLLAILCSNNQCAYIRTSDGWAYTDDENDNGQSIVVDEISQMIDDSNRDIQYDSEQCRHLLKNASYLYYKLI